MFLSKANFNRLLCSLLLGVSSYGFAEEVALNNLEQQIDQYRFTLESDTTECKLLVDSNDNKVELALSLSTPCYWVTKSDSTQAQHYSYPESNISHTLLIAGTPLDWSNEKKTYHKLPLDTYCTQHLQGIKIKDEAVILSNERMDAPNCIGQTIDEKVFSSVALHKDSDNETNNEKGLFEAIKKTFSQLFTSEESQP